MTATLTDPAAVRRADGGGPGTQLAGLCRSEWTKIRSVRSTVWSLVLMVVTSVGFTTLLLALSVAQWSRVAPAQRVAIEADPIRNIIGAGFQFSQLAVCVLGVLVISSEYSSGTIQASLLAVPRRTPMLLAKALVFALVVFVVGEIAALGCFAIGAPILNSKVPVGFGTPGALNAIVGAGLYVTVLGVFSIAVGAIVRRTAGGITGIIAFVLVLAPLAQLLPGSIGVHVHAFLPTVAGQLILSSHHDPSDLLTPWQGFGVFCAWTVGLLAVANFLLRHRDA